MARRRWIVSIAVVGLLTGCGPGGGARTGDSPDRLRQQARDALARYDRAVLAAGGQQSFVPVGDLTGQIGDWAPADADAKRSLLAGRVQATAVLPDAPRSTGAVIWDGGATMTVTLVSANETLRRLAAAGNPDCDDCVPLEVTGARLTTARINTTRGPATVPVWEFTLSGKAVRLTRLAVDGSTTVKVTPPSWDPYHAPGGLAIESATAAADGRRLTVTFTGAPDPASKPCGIDYTAEAVESARAIVVIVNPHQHAAGEMCTDLGAPRTATVDLAAPLGERAVLEVQQGTPVPLAVA